MPTWTWEEVGIGFFIMFLALTKAIWKIVKNCLEDETCHPVVREGRGILEEVQDSMSETERAERTGARSKLMLCKKEKGTPPW